VGLKLKWERWFSQPTVSSNRTIVGLKLSTIVIRFKDETGSNRTIVGLKL